MTSTMSNDVDPFAGGDSVPSISFKDAPIGTVYTGTVLEAPSLVQSRDFESGEPAFWPGTNGQQGNPKMSVVVRLALDTGEERSLWAQKPSAMFAALAQAQKDSGSRIVVGGTLAVKYTGDKPNANPRLNAQKLYAAKFTPPAASDPFSEPAAQQAAAAAPAADAWNPAPATGDTKPPPF